MAAINGSLTGSMYGDISGGYSMGAQSVGSFYAVRAARKAMQFNMEIARQNAAYLQELAADHVRTGMRDESFQRLRTGQLRASQRARLAANGVIVDQGSALSLQQDTDLLGNVDALAIRENAAREAAAKIRERNNVLYEAAGAQIAAGSQNALLSGFNSLVTSGDRVADQYVRYQQYKYDRGITR